MTVAQPRADLGAASDEVATHTLLKVAFASAIGTIVEWYDFFIYATASGLVSTSCSSQASIRWSADRARDLWGRVLRPADRRAPTQ
jgi:hypothetical protein